MYCLSCSSDPCSLWVWVSVGERVVVIVVCMCKSWIFQSSYHSPVCWLLLLPGDPGERLCAWGSCPRPSEPQWFTHSLWEPLKGGQGWRIVIQLHLYNLSDVCLFHFLSPFVISYMNLVLGMGSGVGGSPPFSIVLLVTWYGMAWTFNWRSSFEFILHSQEWTP